MRKITTLLMLLLLCSIGAKAQDRWDTGYKIKSVSTTPVQVNSSSLTTGYYLMVNKYWNHFLSYDESSSAYSGAPRTSAVSQGIGVFSSTNPLEVSGASTNKMAYVVKVSKSSVRISIQVSNGQYINNIKNGEAVSLTSTAPNNIAASTTNGGFAIVNISTWADYLIASTETTGGDVLVGSYSSESRIWNFYEVQLEKDDGGDEGPTATYNVNFIYKSWGGEEIRRTTSEIDGNTKVDATYLSDNDLNKLAYYKDFAVEGGEVTVTGDCDITITCTPDFPFTEGYRYALRMPYHKGEYQHDIYVNATSGEGTSTTATAVDGDNGKWVFSHVPNTERLFTIKNVGNGKYLNMSTTVSHSAPDFVTEPQAWTEGTGASSYFYVSPWEGNGTSYPKAAGGFILCHPGTLGVVVGNHESNKTRLDIWNKAASTTHTDPNSSFFAEEIKADITYNVNAWEEEAPFTVTQKVVEGSSILANDISFEYYKDLSADVTFPYEVTGNATINITCTPDFPFTVGKIYGLESNYKKQVFEYKYDDTQVGRYKVTRISGKTAPSLEGESMYWTIEHVSGTQNLFTIYNLKQRKYLSMSSVPQNTCSNKPQIGNWETDGQFLTLESEPIQWTSGQTPTSYFRITKAQTDGCFLMEHPANDQIVASDALNYSVIGWWGIDGSSRKNSSSEFIAVDAEASLTTGTAYVTVPKTYSFTPEAQAMANSLAEGVAVCNKNNVQIILDGYTGYTEGNTFSELVDEDAVYQIEFDRNKVRVGVYQELELFPDKTGANNTKESATYYGSTTNATADANGNVTTTQVITTVPSEGTGACFENAKHLMSSLWMFEKKQDGQYYARNVNSGLYISGGTGTLKLHFATDKANAHYFVMENGGSDIWAMREPETTYSGREYLNSTYNPGAGNYRTTVGYYKDGLSDNGNKLRFKKISTLPLSVSAAGWTAFCFPVKVTVPEGVTVYQATTGTDSYLHLEEVAAGTVLPAGQGFLCEAAEGSYDFAISTAEADDLSSNLLSGATLKRTGMTAGAYYGLGNKGGNVGFYKANMTTVPANKAFLLESALNVSGAREMLSFQFGPATGIDMTENAAAIDTSVLYDLNGRRVFYPVRGIYVTAEGKKIFLK